MKPNKVGVVFKFDNWVVWPFINPNNEVDVEFNFAIGVVWLLIHP